MSRKSLDTLIATGQSRSPSKRTSVDRIDPSANAPPRPVPIDPQRERALIDACAVGDPIAASAALARLQDHQATGRQLPCELDELVGYAFSCAAGGGHVRVLQLLLLSSGSAIRQSLMHGICREARLFAPRAFFHCCFALRYVAFAAVVSVEQRALASLEWLTSRHPREGEDEVEDEEEDEGEDESMGLLMDVDVMRCFRLAFSLACGSFATPSSAASTSQPEQFRPLAMLLLSRYPTLLLSLVHSAEPVDGLLLSPLSSASGHQDARVLAAAQALRSSLLYEYMVNPK